MSGLTHFDAQGRARMVDVSHKEDTVRVAVARGEIRVSRETFSRIKAGKIGKGDVLGVARLAGIMAMKKTSELIPLCHPIQITGTEVRFRLDEDESRVLIETWAKATGPTGVEMEALTGVSVAALTIYDMCKALDKEMIIGEIRLVEKSGGKSGDYFREGEEKWEE
ncbi:cyclic pyranopterin monophosphate synthase MoaC [Calderihabitans maritimus]|uniref:Cyclic pyranopterin monophosphate synthase n=1 Tax=Calderihabitans maritimus TaxID=1246530 RepID=A0A1Z5HUZ8_9FIRM|nr:cyclic pyranopterin monophosphate synthase MoaC [Calderihabitans maritimus]GAW93359.1 molybdenum cofactor biosynthesis protein C [Calderihabitans maritimus]